MAIMDNFKPFFGPPMTPAIFLAKWERKCARLLRLWLQMTDARFWGCGGECEALMRQRLAWEAHFYTKVLTHVLIFDAEALELGCHEYPVENQSEAQLDSEPRRTDASRDAYLWIGENCFFDIEHLRILVNTFVTGAEDAKTAKRPWDWPVWQTLPLAQRHLINDLIMRVKEKREGGKLVIGEDILENPVCGKSEWHGGYGPYSGK